MPSAPPAGPAAQWNPIKFPISSYGLVWTQDCSGSYTSRMWAKGCSSGLHLIARRPHAFLFRVFWL